MRIRRKRFALKNAKFSDVVHFVCDSIGLDCEWTKLRRKISFTIAFFGANNVVKRSKWVNLCYHFYYQHNPYALKPGPISWGHAVSKDLVHWTNLPIAIPSEGDKYRFSGCAILDYKNLTGVATDFCRVPLLAYYTLMETTQDQRLAYSLNNGLTFTEYPFNPVIRNMGNPDFRDPNIIKRNGIYHMVLAVNDHMEFYASTNLLQWQYTGEYGFNPVEGNKKGVWECPALYRLKDEKGCVHDVLIFSENDQVSRVNITQYAVGKFDGAKFVGYHPDKVFWADNGYDNYAGIPYHNDPLGRSVFIAWLSNWLYADQIPTSIWRGQYTVPRELALQNIDGTYYLTQRPVQEFYNLIDKKRKTSIKSTKKLCANQMVDVTPKFKTHSMLLLKYAFDISNARSGKIGIQFGNDLGEFLPFYYNIDINTYEMNRNQSGDSSFNSGFADTTATGLRISNCKTLSGRIILDVASIEVFADKGLNTFSALFFPTKPYEKITLTYQSEDSTSSVKVLKLSISALNSIWQRSKKCKSRSKKCSSYACTVFSMC